MARELQARNIPLSVVVYPWPAQIAHDSVDSRQVRIWREWCEGKCNRFVDLFPAFFAIKEQCPTLQPGCWYLSHFIFGDTHYNSAGDAVVAKVIAKSLEKRPGLKKHQAKGMIRIRARVHAEKLCFLKTSYQGTSKPCPHPVKQP